ncbi:MAG: AAA family ATPase, partial [Bacteroidota bacterium]
MFIRNQQLQGSEGESLFLWGARQTGKSTLLKSLFKDALWFDLLKSDVFMRYERDPAQFREVILAEGENRVIIVDEIQKIPALLDEIHWLIVNHRVKFILSGSS